jgi:hypothetical protein
MWSDDLDLILSKQEEINPSSGFVVSVMNAVRREAAAPPRLPFPWKYALPGLVAAVLAVALLLGAVVEMSTEQAVGQPLRLALPSLLVSGLFSSKTVDAGWVALSLILSLLAVNISLRLAHRRG